MGSIRNDIQKFFLNELLYTGVCNKESRFTGFITYPKSILVGVIFCRKFSGTFLMQTNLQQKSALHFTYVLDITWLLEGQLCATLVQDLVKYIHK